MAVFHVIIVSLKLFSTVISLRGIAKQLRDCFMSFAFYSRVVCCVAGLYAVRNHEANSGF